MIPHDPSLVAAAANDDDDDDDDNTLSIVSASHRPTTTETGLRHRHQRPSHKDQELHTSDDTEDDTAILAHATPILIPTTTPTATRLHHHHHHHHHNNNNNPSSSLSNHNERHIHKILLRIIFGACLFAVFSGSVYMGHLYISALVAIIELLLFRELVRVRYNQHYDLIQNQQIPLFRTTQWCWFLVSIVYTYGDFVTHVSQSNQQLHAYMSSMQYLPTVSFLLYSFTFVLTITTLQKQHLKFQMNQLCWTVLVIAVTVGQLKYIFHNIYNGLIWFVLPCCLVFCNDIMAYVSGMLWGRKFISRPFVALSPNKTWEGFLGGFVGTMICAWYLSRYLVQYPWMICPTNQWTLAIHNVDSLGKCGIDESSMDPIFKQAQSVVNPQMFELLPRHLVKMIPRVVEMCSSPIILEPTDGSSSSSPMLLTTTSTDHPHNPDGHLWISPCISGSEIQQHHHFELKVKDIVPLQIHALWLGLFASLVAPFGGFLASAMKRAYGIKNFDSLIPGHGGVMDRMDCQFLMALCTWVHYNTFVKLATISVPKLTYLYSLLNDAEKDEFLQSIGVTTSTTTTP